MADRVYWKGYLKLSLVTCPVAMAPATSDSDKVRFHNINRKTKNKVASRYVDSVTGMPVTAEDEAKGYARGENDYVVLDEDELESVALESTRTIDIDKFVPVDSIPWIYREKPHYLYPSDDVGAEAFAVIREAMREMRVGGISRLVLYRRERAVFLLPEQKGIVLWTLRYGDEVRDEGDYYSLNKKPEAEDDLVALAKSVIAERTRRWSKELVEDPVQKELLRLIAAKRKSKGVTEKPSKGRGEKGRGDNVIDLFAALKQSLSAGVKDKPRKRVSRD